MLKHKFHTLITCFPWHGFDQDTHLWERERENLHGLGMKRMTGKTCMRKTVVEGVTTCLRVHSSASMLELDSSAAPTATNTLSFQFWKSKENKLPSCSCSSTIEALSISWFISNSSLGVSSSISISVGLLRVLVFPLASECSSFSVDDTDIFSQFFWWKQTMMTRFSIPKIWNFFEFWFCEVETYTKVEYLETLWRVSLITSNHSMPS